MVKQIIEPRYVCEKCEFEYKYYSDAVRCEKSHMG